MKAKAIALGLLASATLLGGCSIVKVSEAGKRVDIISPDQAYNCNRVGSISTSVLDNVVGIPRKHHKIQEELDKLARDQAVLMRADSIVRESIKDGQGSYIAYNCHH
ncbi:MAG: DUF4156 domain-containing protein [Porticoccaceae bacterium]